MTAPSVDQPTATTVIPREPEKTPVCRECGEPLTGERARRWAICDHCGAHGRLPARRFVELIVDHQSFHEMDRRLVSRDPLEFVDDIPYQERLADTRAKTGEADALVTGSARIGGIPVTIAVLDFNFLGGSMGVVVGEKIARAANRAIRKKTPLITIVASGGARMQEGMLSLLQMAKTAAAIQRLHTHGAPYISVLTNPTTGGVFASFASLGDILLAEPRALIGFAGPRVAEQAIGVKLPPGTHTAEFLLAHGMIDEIVARDNLRERLSTILSILATPRAGYKPRDTHAPVPLAPTSGSAWEIVQHARESDRPTSLDYIHRLVQPFVELHGDRAGGDDPAVIAGIGVFRGHAVAVVGQERGNPETREQRRQGRARPEGYRKARRVMALGARFSMPVISLIDTPGAYPGIESEERGLAAELAACMALMSDLPTPTVAAVIGEGGSGGALALAVADRVIMQTNAIYSVIAPEGAATILFRASDRAPELSERLRITAHGLKDLGLIDALAAEPEGGARADPDLAASLVGDEIERSLASLTRMKQTRLVEERWKRYQAIGRQHAGKISWWSELKPARKVDQPVAEPAETPKQDIRRLLPGRGRRSQTAPGTEGE